MLNYAIHGSWEQCSLNVNFITALLWAFCHSKKGCQTLSFIFIHSFLKLVFEPTYFLNFSEAQSFNTFTNRRNCLSFVCSAYLLGVPKQMANIRGLTKRTFTLYENSNKIKRIILQTQYHSLSVCMHFQRCFLRDKCTAYTTTLYFWWMQLKS